MTTAPALKIVNYEEKIEKINIVTARKALDQKCSESNGLPKDEDTKLKKRRTFRREARYIYHQRPCSSRVSYVFRILVVTTRVTPRPHAKPARQTCLASENLPIRNMREACEMHIYDITPSSKKPILRFRYRR